MLFNSLNFFFPCVALIMFCFFGLAECKQPITLFCILLFPVLVLLLGKKKNNNFTMSKAFSKKNKSIDAEDMTLKDLINM